MDSPPPPPPSTSVPPPQLAELDVKREEERDKEMLHRTKLIQFLGRTTPIVLQNDNGNVLSLKNSLNLNPDDSEVSQEKLLSLVAERLIDSNINIDNKDTGYVENQQQNIADAIDLLPRLTTGIDVNIKFRRIGDFEFTPECAIFDLLDIPLYHGWIVDPQDHETADAIGSKSYNTLMGDLVSLETQTMESAQKRNPEDDGVDFVAATTAALGVPSPCLSRGQSFDDSPKRGQSFVDSPQRARKGDIEEEEELLRVLKLTEERSNSLEVGVVSDVNLHESACIKKSELVAHSETVEKNVTDETVKTETFISSESNPLNNLHVDLQFSDVVSEEAVCSFSKTDATHEESTKYGDIVVGSNASIENIQHVSFGQDPIPHSDKFQDKSRSDEHAQNEFTTSSDPDETITHQNGCKPRDSSSLLNAAAASDSSSGQMHHTDEPEAFSSSVDGSEPIYEGEECILDPGTVVYENREPVYEGEVVLAEQVDRGDCDLNSKDKISIKQGELIRNFMKNSASQLTVYGLFCLQDKVKERELCVFFRNNHFNTMFKYEGELYILATDQGYINQPDLVWEKLNEVRWPPGHISFHFCITGYLDFSLDEIKCQYATVAKYVATVNGDTLYMTGNFKEFKMDDHSNRTWDEQNAMASTAGYLASIDTAAQADSSFNSDLQLAIALQQQEFEQQQQEQQPQRNRQQATINSGSGMVTGPQVSRSSAKYAASSKQESSKSKEKCTVM
ncbi:hypothetical protein BUALT_Bualt10G0036100 [Buddleja alternifolia]|uniref:MINDY deubiquitinase domain-containing protein n=1 Tax=Buddleja alternifolia TaxID=168488 RepID=A0AAV6X6R8_9LAMI|nr:hypothetical protein BUALT_Bualt10G0036100 [Buddleja alternifolia]